MTYRTTESTVSPSRARWLAIAVSHVASPPASALAALILAGELAAQGYRWVVVYAGLGVALPLTYLLLLLHRGDVSDLEVVERRQRLRPYAFATLSGVLGVSVLLAGHAPAWIVKVAAGLVANGMVVWLTTHFWKISFHCSTLSLLGVLFWLTRGQSTLLVAGVLAMIWARVSLRRHTLAQALAGTALGIALGFVLTL